MSSTCTVCALLHYYEGLMRIFKHTQDDIRAMPVIVTHRIHVVSFLLAVLVTTCSHFLCERAVTLCY